MSFAQGGELKASTCTVNWMCMGSIQLHSIHQRGGKWRCPSAECFSQTALFPFFLLLLVPFHRATIHMRSFAEAIRLKCRVRVSYYSCCGIKQKFWPQLAGRESVSNNLKYTDARRREWHVRPEGCHAPEKKRRLGLVLYLFIKKLFIYTFSIFTPLWSNELLCVVFYLPCHMYRSTNLTPQTVAGGGCGCLRSRLLYVWVLLFLFCHARRAALWHH